MGIQSVLRKAAAVKSATPRGIKQTILNAPPPKSTAADRARASAKSNMGANLARNARVTAARQARAKQAGPVVRQDRNVSGRDRVATPRRPTGSTIK